MFSWCALLGVGRVARAQTGNVVEGALETVFPTGARSVGMGQAVAASAVGVDALWWNPALIARAQREVAFGIVTGGVIPADVTLGFIYPIRGVASVGSSYRYVDEGGQEAFKDDVQTGAFRTSVGILSGTFAAPFGDRLAVGLTLKVIGVNFSKTGLVEQAPPGAPRTGAIDVGGQYILTKDSLFVIGASVRNLGLPLQINDAPQADPLPGRADIGIQFKPRLPAYPEVGVRVAADVVERVTGVGGPGFRVGGELSWMGLYHARAGYVVNGPNGSGPTLGAGASYARWRLDFAQFLSDFETGTGDKPTYLSIRYVF